MKFILGLLLSLFFTLSLAAQEEPDSNDIESREASRIDATNEPTVTSNIKNEKQKKNHHRQNQTIFGNRHRRSGGYGALSMHFGEINNQDAILVGGRGAWVVGSGFGMGFGIYGLANEVVYNDLLGSEDLQLEMAYGGLLLEPIIAPWLPVHISFPTIIGMGGALYTDNSFRHNDRFDWDRDVVDDDLFFVVEPGAYIELHLVRFFRLCLGAQYRFLGDFNLVNTGKKDFNGWTGGVTLKFGTY
jgi:hypothetical protein